MNAIQNHREPIMTINPNEAIVAAYMAQAADNRDVAQLRGVLARFAKHPFISEGEYAIITRELMAA